MIKFNSLINNIPFYQNHLVTKKPSSSEDKEESNLDKHQEDNLRIEDPKFHSESKSIQLKPISMSERLYLLKKEGMSGRGAQLAASNWQNAFNETKIIFQEAFQMNETEAEEFIRVLNIDPEKFLKADSLIKDYQIEQIINTPEKVSFEHLPLGKRIGSGFYGVVYDDGEFVIKKFKKIGYLTDNDGNYGSSEASSGGSVSSSFIGNNGSNLFDRETRLQNAYNEASLFIKYYGEGSAKIIEVSDNVFIKMKKLPGRRLCDVQDGGFRRDADKKFEEMLVNLDRNNIWFHDISSSNILYDYETNTFYPIDLSNLADKFSYIEDDNDPRLHRYTESYLDKVKPIIENIRDKMNSLDV